MQNITGKIAFGGIAIGKIKEISKENNVVRRADIYCFFEDEAHRLWMGSRENGIYVAVPEAEKYMIYLYVTLI